MGYGTFMVSYRMTQSYCTISDAIRTHRPAVQRGMQINKPILGKFMKVFYRDILTLMLYLKVLLVVVLIYLFCFCFDLGFYLPWDFSRMLRLYPREC